MRLFAVMGSPRKGGNTDLLLDEFIRGFRAGGGKAEKVRIGDLAIAPCRALRDCEKTGECAIDDDMQSLGARIRDADRIAVAAPIFFYGLPAQLKAAIDRGQAFWARQHLLKIAPEREKEAFVLLVGATEGANLFQGSLLTWKYFFEPLGLRIAGKLLYRKIDRPGDIAQHPSALSEAFREGKKFAAGPKNAG